MTTHLIGIDVGTSSAKAVLIDEFGTVLETVAPEYDFSTPHPLWAESDPADWWEATVKAIRALLEKVEPSSVAGIGLTGQMHGMVALDGAGSVLRPCIMWNDQRTAAQCEAITKQVGAEKVIQLTGNPVLPGFTAPKTNVTRRTRPNRENRPVLVTYISRTDVKKAPLGEGRRNRDRRHTGQFPQ